ncbi:MAG TPA: hypothetical protein VFW33_19835 [Gemmataceae bacterium]|nr:hypothetical protein [Gemmataceae bacterium]
MPVPRHTQVKLFPAHTTPNSGENIDRTPAWLRAIGDLIIRWRGIYLREGAVTLDDVVARAKQQWAKAPEVGAGYARQRFMSWFWESYVGATVTRLREAFDSRRCYCYAAWLNAVVGEGQAAPPDPIPEEEATALRGVIDALDYLPNYRAYELYVWPDGRSKWVLTGRKELPLKDRQELEQLRMQAFRLARARLDAIAGADTAFDAGRLFLDFSKLRRRLLVAVFGNGKVPIQEVLHAVYHKEK